MLSLIWTGLIGVIVGALAKWLSPGKDPGGFWVTMLIGVAGAFLARFVGSSVFGWYRDGTAPGWIMSILGAVVLLWLYRLVQSKRGA
nr:GlsB/YeaQ/YmgE family stress response membrane protein [Polymorphobacter sp.]